MVSIAERESQAESWGYNSGQFLDDLVMGRREPTRENLAVARFASAMLGHRIRAATMAANQQRDLLRFAGKMASNPVELAGYIKVALPDSGFVRMLEAGSSAKEESPAVEESTADVPDQV